MLLFPRYQFLVTLSNYCNVLILPRYTFYPLYQVIAMCSNSHVIPFYQLYQAIVMCSYSHAIHFYQLYQVIAICSYPHAIHFYQLYQIIAICSYSHAIPFLILVIFFSLPLLRFVYASLHHPLKYMHFKVSCLRVPITSLSYFHNSHFLAELIFIIVILMRLFNTTFDGHTNHRTFAHLLITWGESPYGKHCL